MIHGHGNELALYAGKDVIDFSSNVSFEGLHWRLKEYLTTELACIANYPEADANSLVHNLAKHHGLENTNVWVANGSCEAFYTLARIFEARHSAIIIPSFSEYEDASRLNKHRLSFIKNNEMGDDFSSYDLVWMGNPNNPDGKVLTLSDIAVFCEKNPDVYFIVDEAYAELCEGFESSIPLLDRYKNLIVVKSLTKTFAIPGIRIGYVLADNEIVKQLNTYSIPWNINSLAIKAGNFILGNYYELLPDIPKILSNSFSLQSAIEAIDGFRVVSSKCNYFLVQLKDGQSHALKQYLIDKKGILIRDASNFKGLNTAFIRIAAQCTEKNKYLIESLKAWKH